MIYLVTNVAMSLHPLGRRLQGFGTRRKDAPLSVRTGSEVGISIMSRASRSFRYFTRRYFTAQKRTSACTLYCCDEKEIGVTTERRAGARTKRAHDSNDNDTIRNLSLTFEESA